MAAAALPLSIADFAFRYSLDASDEGRVYRLHLANDIFRGLRRPYERDLAVFDSESNPVPFIVRDAEKPYRASDESAPGGPVKLTVPLFSLPPAEKPSALTSAPTMDVTIKTGRDGQVIEIVGGATPGGGTNRFLADLSKAEAPEDGRPILGY
ncbi:MAG: DUF3999 domain-containing protein, partial [Synergistaceae bacterium]|nr:DUF3999 domain-containing protein [Synergistaceae bacterium]